MPNCWHAGTALAQLYQKRSVMVPKTSIAASQTTPHTASTANKAVTTQHLQELMQAKSSYMHSNLSVAASNSHWTAVHLAAASKAAHCSITAVMTVAILQP